MEEGIVQDVIAFIAHEQAAVAVEPGEVALHDPALASQPLTRVDAFAGDTWDDAAAAERSPVATGGIAQVGMQFVGPSAGTTGPAMGLLERRDGVDQALQDRALIHVGRRAERGQWCAVSIGDEMVMGARFAAVGRVRPHFGSPFLTPLAGIREASALARRQSILPASARCWSNTWCNRSQTPARCQTRKRFQSVMPQHPNSCGKYSQGMPVLSTKIMPVSATRFDTGGCPRVPGERVGGSSGSTTAHSSSLTSGLVIPQCRTFRAITFRLS